MLCLIVVSINLAHNHPDWCEVLWLHDKIIEGEFLPFLIRIIVFVDSFIAGKVSGVFGC